MKNVTYYNAGAGSGKTYQLITLLVDLIAKGEAKPQELILTTFTEKAAAEFREKAKARLYEMGMFDEALQIDNAMIGTIHSVCKQMIDKYWYMLGLVPNMGVIDEDSQQFYMSQSLGNLPTKEEYAILRGFAVEFGVPNERKTGIDENFWRKQMETVIGLATNYELTDFSRSEEESLKFIKQFVNPTAQNATISDEEFDAILKEVRNYIDTCKKPLVKDAKALDDLMKLVPDRGNKTIAWRGKVIDILDSKFGPTCSAVLTRGANLWRSPEVYEAQKNYFHTLFELARRWQDEYKQFKREKNLIDYNDMEHYMFQLLQKEDARKNITQSYRYLFVDEFQDCSPIQIKLFTELNQLVQHTYLVGDYKQSIYGFRGTDIDMVKAVKEGIDKEDVHTLGTSYRSLPPIVNVNNHLFTRLFADQLQPEEVILKANRKEDLLHSSLRYTISGSKSGLDVRCVAKLLHEGAKPNEIAVLARTNSTLDKIAEELHDLGIANCLGQKKLADTQTWTLVASLLSIVDNPNDTLARAQVALLTDTRYGTREIIEKRLLQSDDNEFLSDVPLIDRLLTMRDKLRAHSVTALVEQMVIELGLHQVVKQVETDSTVGIDCLQSIMSSARTYEEHCLQLNMPASIVGFIQYFESMNPTGFGNPDGVQLLTYHGSKGLQWKYVILTSLDYKIDSDTRFIKRNIYGVHFERISTPTSENPNPEVYIRLSPWIYATRDKVPGDIDNILQASDLYRNTVDTVRKEECRLFYVGMTRPRDVLIVAVKELKKGLDFSMLMDLGYNGLNTKNPEGREWDIFGTGDCFVNYAPTEAELVMMNEGVPDQVELMLGINDAADEKVSERRYISPSGVKGTMQIGDIHDFHYRLGMVGNNPDMTQVGNCIHHIFASIEDMQQDEDCNAIKDIIRSYGLEDILMGPERIATAWKNLKEYLTATYGAPVHTWHERPFRMERDGQTIVGSIDLVWQTAEGDILIDFKSNPNGPVFLTNPESEHFAGHYGGQVSTYRKALEAAGETVLKTFLYYHISGLLVELK